MEKSEEKQQMTGEPEQLKIISEEPGRGTGDRILQTDNGRWWERWDKIDRTGQTVKTKIDGFLE